jgi:hypothetical protein
MSCLLPTKEVAQTSLATLAVVLGWEVFRETHYCADVTVDDHHETHIEVPWLGTQTMSYDVTPEDNRGTFRTMTDCTLKYTVPLATGLGTWSFATWGLLNVVQKWC